MCLSKISCAKINSVGYAKKQRKEGKEKIYIHAQRA
jgi:hypothetical protein